MIIKERIEKIYKGLEAKLTPIKRDIEKLEKISAKLGIQNSYLVGKLHTGNYDDFIYGALI